LDINFSNIQYINRSEDHPMNTLHFDVPAMYGDHHVTEVRRILIDLPGVEAIYASSYTKTVEVTFDPGKIDAEAITEALAESGYLEPVGVPHESGQAAYGRDSSETYFRHSVAYEQVKDTVSFAQTVNFTGRALYPCPGVGVLAPIEDGE
jgi:copper chaperone CopZ